MPKKKKLKQKAQDDIRYIECSDIECPSRRHQVMTIECSKDESVLTLSCLLCGLLSNLSLPGMVDPELKPIERRDISYLG